MFGSLRRGVVRGSHLFGTAGTVLTALAGCDFIIGVICLAAFVWDVIRGRKAG